VHIIRIRGQGLNWLVVIGVRGYGSYCLHVIKVT
jgi:hypothetical protein